MDPNARKQLVENTKVVTLNGHPAKLLGWDLDKALVVCLGPLQGKPKPAVMRAEFDWDEAARIVTEQDGKFTSKEN